MLDLPEIPSVLGNPVLHLVHPLQEDRPVPDSLWFRYIRPILENRDLLQDLGDLGLLLNLGNLERQHFPHLLSVLQLQSDLHHLCDPSPQEAPVGLGTLVAPEDPVDPMDQELPWLL